MKFVLSDGVWTQAVAGNTPQVAPVKYYSIGTVTTQYGAVDGVHAHPHQGIDFACPTGTEIHAPFNGVVSQVVDYGNVNLGKAVFVTMPDGKIYAVGHLSSQKVQIGQQIHQGDLLGLSGSTGHSTGSHLHFSMYSPDGTPVNPGHITWSQVHQYHDLVDKGASIHHQAIPAMASPDPTPPIQLPSATDPIPATPMDLVYHSNTVEQIHSNVHTSLVSFPNMNEVGTKVGEAIGNGVHTVMSPITDGIGNAFYHIFVSGMHALPMLATCIGLVCFILTIAMGNGKAYAWGLGSWAFAALTKVMTSEMGV